MKSFVVPVLATVLVTLAACSAPTPASSAARTAATTKAAPRIELSQRCTNAQYGISIAYPDRWQTNDDGVMPPCSAFDPDMFQLPANSEIPFEIAIVVRVENVAVEELTRSSPAERVLSTTKTTVGGKEGYAVELEATGEGLADRGLRTYRIVADLGSGRTLVAATHSAAKGYAENKETLKRMVATVSVP